ncbi:hypothetical protein NQ318_018014 [Aromia moschata]|uniref:Uncharacterized protein n=1 Tax=Aromia moschata TaxID=1265417 RepID=A0AAV8YBC3_9CUCU|nr:hypothetical protein NQ318_018014 [Aromia moschata]
MYFNELYCKLIIIYIIFEKKMIPTVNKIQYFFNERIPQTNKVTSNCTSSNDKNNKNKNSNKHKS